MAKYIISGTNGNVGSLIKHSFNDCSVYNKDIKSSTADIFIHLASKSNANVTDTINSNINYLLKTIDFCKQNNIKKFIFFSAMSIYNNTNKEDITEEDYYFDTDFYSTSKLFGENILKESELKVLIIRLPMVLTRESNNGILNRILNKLENNEDIILQNSYKLFNNFISVDDIYNFIVNYTFEKKFERINLGSKKDHSLLQIIKFLKKKTLSKSKIIISKEECTFFNISIKKAKRIYNYKPIKNKKILLSWLKMRRK